MNQGEGRNGFGLELELGKWFTSASKVFGLSTSLS
jgi:hypothetical protein